MTSLVEQDRQPRRMQRRLALGAIAGILALGIVWLPSHEGTALLVLKVGCTLALWAFVLTELAITGHRVRQARAAERRAEHTRQVLAEALDVLPQAVAIFDPADRPVLVNQRFAELQGPLSPMAGAGRRRPVAATAERSLPDGRWVRIDGHRTRNGYRITVSSDVTELKRQKAELARRSRLLETTLNAADRGICIWGPDGRLTMWNGQVAGLLDLPAELLTAGRSFAEFEAFLTARGEAALAGAARSCDLPSLARRRGASGPLRTRAPRRPCAGCDPHDPARWRADGQLWRHHGVPPGRTRPARGGGTVPASVVGHEGRRAGP